MTLQSQLSPYFDDLEAYYNLQPGILNAVAKIESNYNPDAVSPKGAQGMFQFMPATARRFGVKNARDPFEAAEGAAKYLAHLSGIFNNNLDLILAGYNAGEGAVQKAGGVPNYKETRAYVSRGRSLIPSVISSAEAGQDDPYANIVKSPQQQGSPRAENSDPYADIVKSRPNEATSQQQDGDPYAAIINRPPAPQLDYPTGDWNEQSTAGKSIPGATGQGVLSWYERLGANAIAGAKKRLAAPETAPGGYPIEWGPAKQATGAYGPMGVQAPETPPDSRLWAQKEDKAPGWDILLNQDAQERAAAAQRMTPDNFLGKVLTGLATGIGEAPAYLALGASGLPALGALENLDQGQAAVQRGAVSNTLLAGTAIASRALPWLGRFGAVGGASAGLTAAQGGGPTDIAAAGVTGGLMGAGLPGGKPEGPGRTGTEPSAVTPLNIPYQKIIHESEGTRYAPEERSIETGRVREYPRDDALRAPTESGRGRGLKSTAEIQEEVRPQERKVSNAQDQIVQSPQLTQVPDGQAIQAESPQGTEPAKGAQGPPKEQPVQPPRVEESRPGEITADPKTPLGKLQRALPRRSSRETPEDRVIQMNIGINPITAWDSMLTATGEHLQSLGRWAGGRLAQKPWGKALLGNIEDVTSSVIRGISPMADPKATSNTRAAAQAWINADRASEFQYQNAFKVLNDSFSPQERRQMWERLSEANVAERQGGNPDAALRNGLSEEQYDVLKYLQERHSQVADEAVKLGVLKSKWDYYDPRRLVEFLSPTQVKALSQTSGKGPGRPLDGLGKGFTKEVPRWHRKYMTAQETETAAKQRFADRPVELLRDIQVLPYVTQQLERAVAGKKLLREIQTWSTDPAVPSTIVGGFPEGVNPKDYFTIPTNRAFYEWRPAYTRDAATGKMVRVPGAMEQVPIQMHRAFEGPLKAVLRSYGGFEQNALYRGLMQLKRAGVMFNMYFPTTHLAVEIGRSLPVVGYKIATPMFWKTATRLKSDPDWMQDMIQHGMAPISDYGHIQDITTLAAGGPQAKAGIIARGAGKATTLATGSEQLGTTVTRGITKGKDFWENTLLWRRIGDLQAGVADYVFKDLIKQGLDVDAAKTTAAHFSNRLAGAMPRESSSAEVRAYANLRLFSRSFTLGNLGLMKDAITGLPKGTQDFILKTSGEAASKAAVSSARRLAFGAVVADVSMYLGVTALGSAAFGMLARDQSLSQIEREYANRLHDFLANARHNPLDWAFGWDKLLPQSSNEPGKQDRIYMFRDEKGRGQYLRFSLGKVGEELAGYLQHPFDMLHRKSSNLMATWADAYSDQHGFGRKVWQPDESVFKNLTKIPELLLEHTLPLPQIAAASRLVRGKGDWKDTLKVFGPAIGVSVSQGAPGGPQEGVRYQIEENLKQARLRVTDAAIRLLREGNIDQAKQLLSTEGRMTPKEVARFIQNQIQGRRPTRQQLRHMFPRATPEELKRYQDVNQ